MWELFTGSTLLLPGATHDAVLAAAAARAASGARPEFPPGAPPAYASLARDCWAADPAARPTMGAVARRLQAQLAGAEAAAAP
jgi:hypothetical protein